MQETPRPRAASCCRMPRLRRPKTALLVLAALAGSLPLAAQFPKHNVTFGGGAAQPGASLKNVFSPTGFVRVGYGYRIFKNLEATAGVDSAFLAAGVKDFYQSQFGPLRIRDYQYMVPFGGRVVLPFGEDERFRVHAGAGGAYLRYSERSSQPFSNSGIKLDCPSAAPAAAGATMARWVAASLSLPVGISAWAAR
jgi:hypothetical protein